MLDAFLYDNLLFESYSTEHWAMLIFWTLFGVFLISYGEKNLNKQQQERLAFNFTLIIALAQLMKIVLRIGTSTFDLARDLPLHLCNFLPFILLFAFYKKSIKIWSVVFIWIIVGTSQANFTPSLENNLPHFDAVRYWINHCGLVIAALMPVFFWGWKMKWFDILRSLFWLNITALIVYPINLLVGGNYMYLVGKPPGKTFFDLLGDWPVYILNIEFVFIILGAIVVFPFYIKNNNMATKIMSDTGQSN